MKNIGRIFLTLSFLLSTGAFAQVKFQDGSFADAKKMAAKEKKTIMVDFYTDWCHWCKVLDQTTYANKNVGEVANKNFVSLKINAEQGEGVDLAKQYGVQAYPTIVFFDAKGKEVDRVVGYQDAERFQNSLKTISYGGLSGLQERVKTKEGEKDAALWYALGEMQAKAKNTGEAMTAFDKAIALDPENALGIKADATFGKGYALDGPEQFKALDEAYHQFPQYRDISRVVTFLVSTELASPNPEQALIRMDEYAPTHINDGDLFNMFAWEAAKKGLFLNRLEEYANRALYGAHDPATRAQVLDTKAEIYFRLGRKDDALATEKQGMSLLDAEKDAKLIKQLGVQLIRFETEASPVPETSSTVSH